MKKEVIAHKDPKSPISEVFRTLRTNIQFMNNSKKMKTLLVTSTFPGEGKSWVTSNLAVTFAQTGKRVIIIDADMRKGREYAIFGVSPRPGLSNLLSEWDDETDSPDDILNYVQETEVENLYVIAAGNVPPNPSELLVSRKMKKVLNELKSVCDLIIIDGTPSELVTDSVILSRIVDSTIIVTAHKITKKEALQRVVRNIKNVGGNIAGVVINKVPTLNKKYGEKYYYYGHDGSSSHKGRTSRRVQEAKMNYEYNQRRALDTLQRDRMLKEDLIKEEEERLARKGDFGITDDYENDIPNETPRVQEEPNKEEFEVRENSTDNNNANSNSNISFEKTNDILKQINDYLDNEKKNLD